MSSSIPRTEVRGRVEVRSLVRRLAGRTSVVWGAWISAALFVPTVFLARYLFWDSYYDLYAGRYIARHGIPRHESLTFAARGKEWIDQQWLAHLAYYEVWRLGGYVAVALLSSALIASAFGLLGALLIERGLRPHRALCWALLGFVTCLGSTVIRAQSFSFPLFVLILMVITFDAEKARFRWRLALVVPILALWANLHGAVLIGVLLVGGYAAARGAVHAARKDGSSALGYGAVALAAALTPFMTPYGLAIIDYYSALVGNPVLKQFILEWSPQRLDNPFSYVFLTVLLLVAVSVAYGLGRGYRPRLATLGITVGLAVLASQGIRYQVWFSLAGIALVAETLSRVRPVPPDLPERMKQVGAFVVVAAVATSALILVRTPDAQFESLAATGALDAAARYAVEHPQARILADDQTSSGLLWRHPRLAGRVGFDARLEQYSRTDLARWFTYLNATTPDWARATVPYDVLVVSTLHHPELARRLEGSPAWRPIYRGTDTLVVVRAGNGF